MFGLEVVIAGDGGERTQEQVAGVGHDGGAARRDFVAGLELIEFAEGMIDGDGVAELLDVPDEGRATASAGGALLTMGRDRIGIDDGCSSLRVHVSSFRS